MDESNKKGTSLEGSRPSTPTPTGSMVLDSVASDEISGVFRFLRDYRLTAPPGEWAKDDQQRQYELSSETSSIATGSSLSPSRGGGPLHHTPMGSTTKLIAEKNRSPSSGWRCLPSFGTFMVAISLVAGLGNITRLPTAVFLNGGGSFLVIYIAISLVFGIPLVFLEIVLGQFCQEGPIKLWRAVPILKGVGFVKVFISILLAIYYPVIMALALFYTLWSSKEPLPFSECKNLENGVQQSSLTNGEACLEQTFLKPADQDPMWFGVTVTLLFLLWAIVMLCVSRGARSYRVSAFFLLVPLVAGLIALFTEQVMLDTRGLETLLQLDWKRFLTFDTWYFAVIQLFFSTQIGFGNITTNAGRVFSKSNAFWTAVLYIICNLAVGITFVCLVYLWMARLETNGVTLIGPKIPELFVLTFMYDVATRCFVNNAQIWAAVMFLVVVFAGLISMVALVYTVVVSIVVETKERWRPWLISAGFCSVGFLVGIICLLPPNAEVVHMLDYYVISHMVVAMTALELFGFVWLYGTHSLYNDFEFVLGQKLNILWSVIWFITPVLLVVMEVWSFISLPLKGTRDKVDPEWLFILGWAIYALSGFVVLIIAIWQISVQVDYNVCQKFMSSLKPSRNWGPVDPIQRHGWVVWREQVTLSGERDFTLKRRGTRDYTHSVRNAHNDPLGTRYFPNNTKISHSETTSIQDYSPGRPIQQSTPNYNSTHNTDVNIRAAPPFIVQLPEMNQDHVCWRKDAKSERTS